MKNHFDTNVKFNFLPEKNIKLIFLYICKRLWWTFLSVKGNPVKIRSCTRSCEFRQSLLHFATAKKWWEGVTKRNKPEDLPQTTVSGLTGI